MGKSKAIAARSVTRPYADKNSPGPRATATKGVSHGSAASSKYENTLLGLPRETFRKLSKTVRQVWSRPLEDRESSLVSLSRKVEARQRTPKAMVRMMPPGPPKPAHAGRSQGAPLSEDDIETLGPIAMPPPVPAAAREAASARQRKRSRFIPFVLGVALLLACSAYVLHSRLDVFGAAKSAWSEVAASLVRRFEQVTSGASPAKAEE